MRIKAKRSWLGLGVSGGLWAIVIAIVIGTQPGNIWWETVGLSVLNLAIFLTVANVTKKAKWGVIVAVIVTGSLILNRLGLLNFWSGGGLLVMTGLLSLID